MIEDKCTVIVLYFILEEERYLHTTVLEEKAKLLFDGDEIGLLHEAIRLAYKRRSVRERERKSEENEATEEKTRYGTSQTSNHISPHLQIKHAPRRPSKETPLRASSQTLRDSRGGSW